MEIPLDKRTGRRASWQKVLMIDTLVVGKVVMVESIVICKEIREKGELRD
jgi:hypothetical protein